MYIQTDQRAMVSHEVLVTGAQQKTVRLPRNGNIGPRNPYTWGTVFSLYALIFPGIAADMGYLACFLFLLVGYGLFYIAHEVFWYSALRFSFTPASLRGLIVSYEGMLPRIVGVIYEVFIVTSETFFIWFNLIVFGDLVVNLKISSSYVLAVITFGIVLAIFGSIFSTLRKLRYVASIGVIFNVCIFTLTIVYVAQLDWTVGWGAVWKFNGISQGLAPVVWGISGIANMVQLWHEEIGQDVQRHKETVFWYRFQWVFVVSIPLYALIIARGPAIFMQPAADLVEGVGKIAPLPVQIATNSPFATSYVVVYFVLLILTFPFMLVAPFEVIHYRNHTAGCYGSNSSARFIGGYVLRLSIVITATVLAIFIREIGVSVSIVSVLFIGFTMLFLPLTLWYWNALPTKPGSYSRLEAPGSDETSWIYGKGVESRFSLSTRTFLYVLGVVGTVLFSSYLLFITFYMQ